MRSCRRDASISSAIWVSSGSSAIASICSCTCSISCTGTRQARAARVAGPSYNDLSDPQRLDGPSGNAALNGTPVRVEALA